MSGFGFFFLLAYGYVCAMAGALFWMDFLRQQDRAVRAVCFFGAITLWMLGGASWVMVIVRGG